MRTFIAVELPPTLQEHLRAEQVRLRSRLRAEGADRAFRWTGADRLHLTLRFLGETDASQRDRIIAGLQEIVRERPRFALCLQEIGAFPNWKRIRVLWMGIGGDVAELQGLQSAVERLVQRVGFPSERQAYTPHITLARAARDASRPLLRTAAQVLQNAARQKRTARPPGDWTVDEVVYIRSVLGPKGARYTPLARLPFG